MWLKKLYRVLMDQYGEDDGPAKNIFQVETLSRNNLKMLKRYKRYETSL